MKLSTIVNEGIQYRDGMSLDDFRAAEEKYKQTHKPADNPTKLFRDGGTFVFQNEDTDEDLIHIEPVLKAKKLPVKDRDKNALSTFEFAEIIYGYTVREPQDYFGPHTDPDLSAVPEPKYQVHGQSPQEVKVYELVDDVKKLGSPSGKEHDYDSWYGLRKVWHEWQAARFGDLTKLVDKLRWHGQSPRSDWPSAKMPSNLKEVKRFAADWSLALRGIKNRTLLGYDEEDAIEARDVAMQLANAMEEIGLDTIESIPTSPQMHSVSQEESDQALHTIEAAMDAMEAAGVDKLQDFDKATRAHNKTQKDLHQREVKKATSEHENEERSWRRSYIGKLQISFARAVKHPQNDYEVRVQTAFVEENALLIMEKLGSFDVIAYPESRQPKKGSLTSLTFNEMLARNITDNPIQIPKADVPTINMEELELRAGQIERRVPVERQTPRGVKITQPDDPNWEKEWALREAAKIKAKGIESIKSFQSGDKRRYIQLFTAQGIDPERIKGADVLIIDDNVHHQGTMEMLHALIDSLEPHSVTLYTPFLLRSFR